MFSTLLLEHFVDGRRVGNGGLVGQDYALFAVVAHEDGPPWIEPAY